MAAVPQGQVPAPGPVSSDGDCAAVVDALLLAAVEETAEDVAFEAHRLHTGCGAEGFLDAYGAAHLLRAPSGTDALGNHGQADSKLLVLCPTCGNRIAAVKFAMHYDRCGKASSQAGRRARKGVAAPAPTLFHQNVVSMTPKQALLRPIVPKRPRPRAKIPEGYALTGIRLRVQLLPQSLGKRGDGQPFLTTKVAWLQGGGGAGAEAGAGTPAEAAQAAGGADAGAGARGPAAEAAAEGNG